MERVTERGFALAGARVAERVFSLARGRERVRRGRPVSNRLVVDERIAALACSSSELLAPSSALAATDCTTALRSRIVVVAS